MNTLANNSFQTATLIRVQNPFDVADQIKELLPLSDRVRLGGLITLEKGFAVSVNGELLEDNWSDREIIDGDYIVVCPVPAGGGGGKNILRVVALIAISIAAPYAAAGILGTTTGALGVGGMALSAGITIAGSMLVNSLIPIEQSIPQAQSLEGTSPSYGIDGPKNSSAEGIPVPVIYGTYRVGGNIVNIHTENVTSDDTQDLNILFALSEGPIAAIDLSTIEINDQPIDNFSDVVIDERLGYAETSASLPGPLTCNPIPWFDDNVTPYSVGVTLSINWHTYTTVTTVDKVRVDILATNGFREINDTGQSLPISRDIEIQYRVAGSASAWITAKSGDATVTGRQLMAFLDNGNVIPVADLTSNFSVKDGTVYETLTYDASSSTYNSNSKDGYSNNQPPGYSTAKGGSNGWTAHNSNTKGGTTHYTKTVVAGYTKYEETKSFDTRIFGKKTSAYRKSFSWNVAPGLYEIRVRRTTDESNDGQIIDKLVWSDLNEITTSDVGYKYTALLGMQIRLTDQLNSQPKVTVVAHGRKVRVPTDWYQVGNPWAIRHTSNPAWIALDMLTNTRYGAGYGDHRIDFYSWMRWADYCDRQELQFNGIFDVNASFWDQLNHVMRCGRAKLVPQGIKYGVAVERADFPAMMFNVSNMKKSSLTINWLSMSDRANEIEATYYDETNGYKASILKVVSPTLQQGQTPRSVALNLIGVTNAEQAKNEARLLLNMNRFIQQTITFEAPVESIACKVGNMVLVQHDIPQWGFGGRTEASSTDTVIKLDRPVNMETGKSYSILLNYDNLLVASGLIESKINNRNFFISSDYIREGVHSLFIGGNEYNVVAIANAGDNVRKILTIEDECPAVAGDPFDLYRLDALEERVITTVAGESTEVTCTTPLPQAPSRYVKWLFGVLEGSQKQFRVLAIEGEGIHSRTLTCVEYYDAIYNSDDTIAEPPNYAVIPVGEQVTGLTAQQIRKNIGTVTQPVIRLEWVKTTQYGGADILIKRNNDNWQPVGQVRSGETSFEFTDLILGETLSFMVIAVDTVGIKATRSGAPIISITVTSAGDVLASPTNIRCKYDGASIRLDYDNPEAAIFLETEIVHATTNNLSLATRLFRGADEVFVHDNPNIGDNFYWLRSINTDKVPGVYSAAVSPEPITQITNLRLKSAFVGNAAEIIWDGMPSAAAYQVEVRTKSVLRRSERVTVNDYRYSIEDALEDGDVDRNIQFTVRAVGADGKLSPSLSLTVSNPAPALPTDLSVAAGFKQAIIEFTPPEDPDYTDTLIWIGTTTGFTPGTTNRVAAIKGGPINIGNLQDNTDYYIRMTCRDAWGVGVTSAEYNVRTLDISSFEGLSPWAYVTDADRTFIENNLANDAIPSEKIVSITASRITTGTLAVTEKISVEGQIEAVAGSMVVTMGPKLIGSKVALFSIMNGTTTLVRFNEDGTNEYRGSIVITGGSGYANLSDKPTSLADVNTSESNKLSGIAPGATNGADWNSTLSNIPNRLASTPSIGLNLTPTYMGYYDGISWQSYIQADGSFRFGGVSNNFLDWNGSKLVINTDNLIIDSAGNASFSGMVSGATISGSTIEASTIKTQTTGERFELTASDNTLRFYNAAGTSVLNMGRTSAGTYDYNLSINTDIGGISVVSNEGSTIQGRTQNCDQALTLGHQETTGYCRLAQRLGPTVEINYSYLTQDGKSQFGFSPTKAAQFWGDVFVNNQISGSPAANLYVQGNLEVAGSVTLPADSYNTIGSYTLFVDTTEKALNSTTTISGRTGTWRIMGKGNEVKNDFFVEYSYLAVRIS